MINRTKCFLYKVYSFLIYVLPMSLLFFLRIEKYTTDGSISFWGLIVLLFIILAFKDKVLSCFKNMTLITMSLFMFAFAVLMENMAKEMIIISLVSFVGAVLSLFISVVADVYENLSYKLVDGQKRLNMARAIPDKEAWKEAYGVFRGRL